MSTRAYIARERRPGEYEFVYNHWDGYPEYLGRILKRNFSKKAAVDELMAGGNISFIHAPTGKIERAKEPGASSVVPDHQLHNMRHTHYIDYLYIYRRGAWKAYDLRDGEVEIP